MTDQVEEGQRVFSSAQLAQDYGLTLGTTFTVTKLDGGVLGGTWFLVEVITDPEGATLNIAVGTSLYIYLPGRRAFFMKAQGV